MSNETKIICDNYKTQNTTYNNLKNFRKANNIKVKKESTLVKCEKKKGSKKDIYIVVDK